MKIANLRIAASPSDPEALRASIEMSYAGRRGADEVWWIEVPADLGESIATNGDPWLVAALPLAWTLGEPLEVALPVDGELLANLQPLQELWSRWFPHFEPVKIAADSTGGPRSPTGRGTAVFFSGGVDSTYNALHSDKNHRETIGDLIHIRGFDIPLENAEGLRQAERRVAGTARTLGKNLIFLRTNIRSTRLREANWERIVHAPLLAGIGHLLGPRYRRLLVGSARPSDLDTPLGSHPAVYPRLRTRGTETQIYAPQTEKTDKVAYLAAHPQVLQHLRVCWESESGGNCGRCTKCLYTMTALEVYGALRDCTAFPENVVDQKRLRGVYMGRKGHYFKDLRARASARGRADLVESLDAAFRRTERLDRWLGVGRVLELFKRWRLNPRARRLTESIRPFGWRVIRAVNRLLTSSLVL